MDDTPLSFRDNYQPHNTGSPLSFVGWCRVGQRGRSGSESAAVGGGSGFGYLDYLRSVFLSFLFFFFPYYLHVERSRRRRIHPPYSPITSRRFVGRCLSHAHIRRNVDHAPGKIPCRERERERRENKKRNAHTHHTHTTNNVHATLYPKYYTNVYPTLLFAVCFRIAMPSILTQLNSTQPPNIHPPTAPSPLFRPPPQHPPRPPLKSPHHLLHHPPRHPSHRHPQRRIREPVPNRQGYLGPSVVPSGGGGYRPPGD